MVKGITESGFEFELNESAVDDMRFLRLFKRVKKEPYVLEDIAEVLIGADGVERLYKHIETEDGRVLSAEFLEKINEMITIAVGEKQAKN